MPKKSLNSLHSKKINILYAKKYDQEDDWFSIPHAHPFTEFFYVIEGEGIFLAEDQEYELKKGDLVIINVSIKHTEKRLKDLNFAYLVMGVDGIGLDEIELNLESENPYVESNIFIANFYEYEDDIINIFYQIKYELDHGLTFSDEIMRNYFNIFLMKLTRIHKHVYLKAETKKSANKQLEYVKDYIDKHFIFDISLDDLSRMVYISKYYLVHEFKKYYGITPIDYLLKVRLENATFHLVNTDYTIKHISEQSGFTSQSYFNQIFRKKIGMTPSQYRKKYRVKQ